MLRECILPLSVWGFHPWHNTKLKIYTPSSYFQLDVCLTRRLKLLPLRIFLDLDPCLDVKCEFHCLCKAFGPFDARCVSADSCPSFQEPICSSNGSTYDNKCLFEQEMCLLQLNFTVQHPGSCEGKLI